MTAGRVVNCPSCGGTVEIRAAGYSITLGCRYCGALLDVADPDVKLIVDYHQAFEDLPLPLGARGELHGVTWEIVGALRRSDDETSWDEMLLFNPYVGYRWLVHGDGEWQFGIMLSDQPVDDGDGGVDWRGRRYARDYEPQPTATDKVVGEFYWRVEAGDKVSACTYSNDEATLSLEVWRDEINWTALFPLDGAEVLRAFVPPSQPGAKGRGQFGRKRSGGASRGGGSTVFSEDFAERSGDGTKRQVAELVMMAFIAIVAAIAILAIMVGFGATTQRIQTRSLVVVEGMERSVNLGTLTVSRPYQFVTIWARAGDFDNRWVDLDYSLVDRKTQRSIDAYGVAEHYSGYDSDGGWSEGRRSARTLIAGVPRGSYDVVVDVSAHRWSQYASYGPQAPAFDDVINLSFTVTAGGMSWTSFWVFVVLILMWPAYMLFVAGRSARWS